MKSFVPYNLGKASDYLWDGDIFNYLKPEKDSNDDDAIVEEEKII